MIASLISSEGTGTELRMVAAATTSRPVLVQGSAEDVASQLRSLGHAVRVDSTRQVIVALPLGRMHTALMISALSIPALPAVTKEPPNQKPWQNHQPWKRKK